VVRQSTTLEESLGSVERSSVVPDKMLTGRAKYWGAGAIPILHSRGTSARWKGLSRLFWGRQEHRPCRCTL